MIKLTQKEIKDILSIVDRADLQGMNINEDNFYDLCDGCFGNGVLYTDSGVSKGVLFLEDYPNLVVKIPFTCCGDDDRAYSYHFSEKDGETTWIREYYDGSFDSAWQSLPDYLQDKLERQWDYCEVETLLFADAMDEGVSDFFAETLLIGYSNGHPVYVQEKARIFQGESEYDDYGEYDPKTSTAILKSRINMIKEEMANYDKSFHVDGIYFSAPRKWIVDFYLYYGVKEIIRLYNFISNTGIEDLHGENVGYINHRPVITDYASFNS